LEIEEYDGTESIENDLDALLSEDELEAQLLDSPQSQVSFNAQDELLVEDELDDEYEIDEDEDLDDELDAEPTIEGSGIKEKFNSLVAKIKKSAGANKKAAPKPVKEKTGLHNVEKTVKTFVDKKLPALANILKKKNKASSNATEEIDTSNIVLEGEKPKRKIEVKKGIIYGLAAIGLIVVFLVEDPPPSEFKSNTAKNKKAPPAKPTQPEVAPKQVEDKPEQPVEVVEVENEPIIEEEPVIEEPVIEEPVIDEPAEVTTELDKEIDEQMDQITKNQNMNLDDLKNTEVEKPQIDEPAQVKETPSTDINDSNTTVTNEDVADDQLSDLDMDQLTAPEVSPETEGSAENNEITESSNEDPTTLDSNAMDSDISLNDSNEELMDEEIIPQPDIQPDISSEITKKLLEDLEVKLKDEQKAQKTLAVTRPTDPPSYDALGMGLVYNCKGSHWACVEKGSYKTCRENYSWNKNEGIPLECYPVAFLENEYDCALLQQEKIDSVAETNFCR
tara:strand:+ start:23776 stop:25290 length:1515 start_codon:yes stop_codon:yes gene_type:complete